MLVIQQSLEAICDLPGCWTNPNEWVFSDLPPASAYSVKRLVLPSCGVLRRKKHPWISSCSENAGNVEKEKSVAMAMAVLRIWHTKPESKKGDLNGRFFAQRIASNRRSSEAFYQPRILLTILTVSWHLPTSTWWKVDSGNSASFLSKRCFFSSAFYSLRWYRFCSSRWEVLMTTWHASWLSYYPGRSSASACHQSLLRGRNSLFRDVVGCALWS